MLALPPASRLVVCEHDTTRSAVPAQLLPHPTTRPLTARTPRLHLSIANFPTHPCQDESLTDKAKSALGTAKHAVRWGCPCRCWGASSKQVALLWRRHVAATGML